MKSKTMKTIERDRKRIKRCLESATAFVACIWPEPYSIRERCTRIHDDDDEDDDDDDDDNDDGGGDTDRKSKSVRAQDSGDASTSASSLQGHGHSARRYCRRGYEAAAHMLLTSVL